MCLRPRDSPRPARSYPGDQIDQLCEISAIQGQLSERPLSDHIAEFGTVLANERRTDANFDHFLHVPNWEGNVDAGFVIDVEDDGG